MLREESHQFGRVEIGKFSWKVEFERFFEGAIGFRKFPNLVKLKGRHLLI